MAAARNGFTSEFELNGGTCSVGLLASAALSQLEPLNSF